MSGALQATPPMIDHAVIIYELYLYFTYIYELVSQPVFIDEDIYRINKLTTTDKALYRVYVASKSILPIYLRELS